LRDKRSKWLNQFHTIEGASNFHNKLRHLFANDPHFKQLKCFQEVLVSSLVETYPNNYDAVDWYIDEYNCVIELHGKQHYQMQTFGSKDSYFNNVKNFNNIKYRDNRKKTFLLNADYSYVEISYKDINKIDSEFIKNKIMETI
jgi:hypothetical protein